MIAIVIITFLVAQITDKFAGFLAWLAPETERAGEEYDARKELGDWCSPAAGHEGWGPSVPRPLSTRIRGIRCRKCVGRWRSFCKCHHRHAECFQPAFKSS